MTALDPTRVMAENVAQHKSRDPVLSQVYVDYTGMAVQ